MCTLREVDHDVFEAEEVPKETIISAKNVAIEPDIKSFCKVCGCKEVQVSLRNKNSYCKACFLPVLTHKFKATLGKSKVICSSDSILIAHSGKANSTVLVHLINASVNASSSKRIPFQYKVLYIDDGMVKGRTLEDRQLILNAFAKEAESMQLVTYFVPLSQYISENIYEEIVLVKTSRISMTQEDIAIQEMFNQLESDTARDELLRQLRRKLLISAAQKLSCNKIFVADTSVDLAIKVLGNVSTGRGSQLPFDVTFSDVRCTDVMLLRPLKDFTGDDLSGYLNCCKLRPIVNSQKHNHSFSASIRAIAKNFVSQLDSEFCGTVSTIYRTSEKLAAKLEKFNYQNVNMDDNVNVNVDVNFSTCIICEMPLYRSQERQLSVIQAKLFSKLVSTNCMHSSMKLSNVPNNEQTKNKCHLKQGKSCLSDCCNSLQRQPSQSYIIDKCLCYSCSLIFLDSNQTHITLPNLMLNIVQQKLHAMQLRDEISDYLL